METQVNELEKEVYALGKESEIQTRMFVKFEETIEKLQDLTESMHRLITIHDERIRVNSELVNQIKAEMTNEIKELEGRITKENQLLSKKIDDSEARILQKLADLQREWKEEKKQENLDKQEEIRKKETFSEKVATLALRFESWKWFILGGAVVAGVLLEKSGFITGLLSIFKMP